jgi:glycosyltransferase involved in cell wall biosynthesis
MSVSVVVPCYRSARILPALVERLAETLPHITDDYELILVVDSPDDTWDAAHTLADKYDFVRAIRMARNYGQHSALIAGLRSVRHEIVVTMDDDLQHPPEELPKLFAALTDDVDLVYAQAQEEEHGFLRSLASRTIKTVMHHGLGVPNAKMLSAFRIFRSFLIGGFNQVRGSHVDVDVVLSWTTTRVGLVRVHMDDRNEGRSGYTFKSLIRHAINMMLGYSTKPLRFVTYLGFAVGVCGLLLTARVLYMYLTHDTTVPGFTTLASLVAVFASAQMIAVGVLGEYIGQVHFGSMGRPTYVIREQTGGPPPQ